MGLLIFLAAGAIFGLLLGGSVIAAFLHQWRAMQRLTWAAGALSALYVAAVATFNSAAPNRVLGPNEELRYCGFYLDCHMAASVTGVRVLDSLGGGDVRATPGGAFWVVGVKVASNARRATLRLLAPTAVVVDTRGRRYSPSPAASAVLKAQGLDAPALDLPVAAGGSYTTSLVFDLPVGTAPYRLELREGYGIDRAIEALIPGDDDGLLHPHPTFALTPKSD